jgi:hypothetical protein
MHRRKIIAGAIITISVGFTLWSLFSSDRLPDAAASIAGKDPVGGTSPSLQFTTVGTNIPSRTGAVLGEVTTIDATNLTDSLINSYLLTMKGKNPSGPTDGKLTIPSGDTVVSLIESGAQDGLPFSRFTERDIRISLDASPLAQKQYLDALDGALTRRFSSIQKTIFDAMNEMNEKNDLTTLNALIGAVSGYIGDVLVLQVPPPLSATHIDWLNLWQEKLATYQAIARSSDDPYGAYVALKRIPALAGMGTQLKEQLSLVYESIKL